MVASPRLFKLDYSMVYGSKGEMSESQVVSQHFLCLQLVLDVSSCRLEDVVEGHPVAPRSPNDGEQTTILRRGEVRDSRLGMRSENNPKCPDRKQHRQITQFQPAGEAVESDKEMKGWNRRGKSKRSRRKARILMI